MAMEYDNKGDVVLKKKAPEPTLKGVSSGAYIMIMIGNRFHNCVAKNHGYRPCRFGDPVLNEPSRTRIHHWTAKNAVDNLVYPFRNACRCSTTMGVEKFMQISMNRNPRLRQTNCCRNSEG